MDVQEVKESYMIMVALELACTDVDDQPITNGRSLHAIEGGFAAITGDPEHRTPGRFFVVKTAVGERVLQIENSVRQGKAVYCMSPDGRLFPARGVKGPVWAVVRKIEVDNG